MRKIIEFFGVSGSGKTKLKNNLKVKNSYDYRSLIYNFSDKYFVLSKDEETSLLYFRIIKSSLVKKIKYLLKPKKLWESSTFKNIKKKETVKNKYLNNYKKIVSKIFQKTKKKNLIFSNFVLNIISNLKCSNKFKELMKFWFKEEFSSYYLSKKISNKNLIDSEGFVQRLIIYLYFSKKKDYTKILQNYLRLMPKIDKLFIVNYNSKKKNIKKYSLPEEVQLKKQIEIFLFIKKFIYKKKKYTKKIKEIIEIKRNLNEKNYIL